MVCSHTEDSVIFPDGTRVLASGWVHRKKGEPTPDFGLYLDPQWTPTWPNVMLDWPDFGVPRDQATADDQIQAAFLRARAGERVEASADGSGWRVVGTVASPTLRDDVAGDGQPTRYVRLVALGATDAVPLIVGELSVQAR